MAIIYHVTTQAEWATARSTGTYEAPSFKEEGFIHCSLATQVPSVLERYFKGKTDLVKLVIDTEKLTSQLVYEWSPSTADTFPHIYGTINTDAVTAVEPIATADTAG
ncbi:DUF952 domain-containing protein [Paraflavitalea pollutisoli]|uniref:DUF952 domain-containing protein n=1 Tax=Paraflavitalea pollutisoli TaxID=3034143 RepID=UPI0023EB5CAF|nr:DUF952 domain-containing protein [Paraflavitalea sp. H1-2-19X]